MKTALKVISALFSYFIYKNCYLFISMLHKNKSFKEKYTNINNKYVNIQQKTTENLVFLYNKLFEYIKIYIEIFLLE